MGRHMSRGLLLWGPPGTGKTLTVRYLTGRLTDATVIILSGGSLGAVGAFGTMARRLAPSVVILEDVDLVAEERTFDGGGLPGAVRAHEPDERHRRRRRRRLRPHHQPPGGARAGARGAARARIDLAVEIPLPDADGRGSACSTIYGRGLDLRLEDAAAVVDRTEGVTASFVKELLRKAALGALDAGREHVTDADVGGGPRRAAERDRRPHPGDARRRRRGRAGAGERMARRASTEWEDEGGGTVMIGCVLEPD